MDFPGNSNAAKVTPPKEIEGAEAVEPKASTPEKIVIEGKVTRRKQPLGKRVKSMFVEDGVSMFDYFLEEVIVPMVKETALTILSQTADGVRQGVERKLFGSASHRPTSGAFGRSNYGGNRVAYNQIRSSAARRNGLASRPAATRPPNYHRTRHSNNIDEIILESREAAQDVILNLEGLIERAGCCTVADYYSLVGERVTSTDAGWGWLDDDLAEAYVEKVGPREYLIHMPRPTPLN